MLDSSNALDACAASIISRTRNTESKSKRRSRAKDAAHRKRSVYVDRACLICKARKTKCDGSSPCEPCQRRSLDCRYMKTSVDTNRQVDDTPESPASTVSKSLGLVELTELVSALQKKVAILEHGAQGEQNATDSVAWKQPQPPSRGDSTDAENPNQEGPSTASPAMFAGPTSANFSFGVARMILEQESGPVSGLSGLDPELAGSIVSGEDEAEEDDKRHKGEGSSMMTSVAPLHDLQLCDALRLIQVYHESIGVLHPIVEIEILQHQVKLLWSNRDPDSSDGKMDLLSVEETAQVQMVLAVALLAEGGGSSVLAQKIHDVLQPAVFRVVFAKHFTMRGQVLLLLTAFYHMFQDDCRLASRYVAITCRLMIEAGLHQRHILLQRFTKSADRAIIYNILSTSIILDRQLNFNAGLPFTLKDADIDIPEMGSVPSYAKAMASYIRIGPPAWAAVTDDRGRVKQRVKDEDFDYLDYQVRCWQESLPKDLHLRPAISDDVNSDRVMDTIDRGTQLLRYILYLRANQFRIVIMRPLLFSSHTFKANIKRVRIVAQIAIDTIETIIEMNERYDLYRKQQPILNLFLSSALSSLFLVYIHSLRECHTCAATTKLSAYSGMVREGLNKGLGLVRSYSSSRSSQRLWKKFAGPHGLLSRLGLSNHDVKVTTAKNTHIGVSNQASKTASFPDTELTGLDTSSQTHNNIVNHGDLSQSVQLTDELMVSSWDYVHPMTYPGSDSFEDANFNPYESYGVTGDFSPLPFLNMNPLLVSNDIDVFYDDVW